MKHQKIVQLCKQNKAAFIFNGEGVQWLSDGNAAYPLYGAPTFSTESLLTLFDVTDKAAEKMSLKELQLPRQYNFDDFETGESETTRGRISFGYNGRVLIPLYTEEGIKFIESKYLSPLAELEDVELVLRRQPVTNKVYFAAKTGFCIRAIIPAADVIDEHFVALLKKIYTDCDVAYQNQEHGEEYEQETLQTAEDGQNEKD